MKRSSMPNQADHQSLNSVAALMWDHSNVEAMCSIFEAALARIDQGGYVDGQMLSGILQFFDQFVEQSHQAKEEHALFPLLRTAGEPAMAMVELLVTHHGAQRAMLRDLSGRLEQLSGDSTTGQGSFTLAARRFVASVRHHLRIENDWFPEICAIAVPPQQDDWLCRQFELAERLAIGPTRREWYTQLLADYRDIVATWGSGFDRSHVRRPSSI